MLGETNVDKATIDLVAKDVQGVYVSPILREKRNFKLRCLTSDVRRCQLWFDKNSPESKLADSPFFIINMILGDIIEAVFKGLLRASNVEFEDSEHVELQTKHSEG